VIAERTKNIIESRTAKIAAKAIRMKREKIDIVDLSVGEPDFPTPKNIKEAAKKAIDTNHTKYTLNMGLIELRQAIIKKFKNENSIEYDLENIIVSTGAKQSLFNAVLTIVGKDDEVIIPAPYWVSYPEMVALAEGKSVIVSTSEESGFKLSAHQLHHAISANTRALILCNPSNPTGTVYVPEELESLAEVIKANDLFVIADEIYEKLVYDKTRFISFASISPEIKEKTVVINGFSKSYSMTGWRIGYAAGSKEVIDGMSKLQSHSTSNASTISQYASLEALNGSQEEILEMCIEFEKRRDFVFNSLSSMTGVSCQKPGGAFYAYPNISVFFNTKYNDILIRNSDDFAYYLLNQAKVVITPGSVFGSDDHIRMSYATSMERLEEGMKRIKAALENLKTQ
jgi:aspartate/methionine/tyrosine aminotransferase